MLSIVELLPSHSFQPPRHSLLSSSLIPTSTQHHTLLCTLFLCNFWALNAIMDFLKIVFFAWMGLLLILSSPTATADAP